MRNTEILTDNRHAISKENWRRFERYLVANQGAMVRFTSRVRLVGTPL